VNEQAWSPGARAQQIASVGEGRRVRAYIGEADHWRGKLLSLALVQKLHDEGAAGATDVMTRPAVTVPADTPLPQAIRRMLDAKKKILPVVDAEGRLTGAVDRADLLRAVAIGGGPP
jgi:CBS domain-containing protein